MAREDGLLKGVGTRFSSEYQPEKRGRKPSKVKEWIKENGVSNEDFIAIFKNIIATYSMEELNQMITGDNKNKLPVLVELFISAFIRDVETGNLTAVNSVLDRIMGNSKTVRIEQKMSLPDKIELVTFNENEHFTPDAGTGTSEV